MENEKLPNPAEQADNSIFDTNHLQTIIWEEDNLKEASEDLKAVIRNSFPADAKMQD